MKYIRYFRESVNALDIAITKDIEIYNFLVQGFPEIPEYLTFERYSGSNHILSCKATIGENIVGAMMFCLLKDKPERVLIPVKFNPPIVHINYIYVADNFRKQKISSRMVNSIIEFAHTKSANIITANVHIGNIPSEKLQTSIGFTMNPTETVHPSGDKMRTFYKLI